jgi:phosphoglycerate dehydrogenase-like enzyme
MEPMVVLVPHDLGVAVLAEVPGVRAVRYRPGEPLPPEATEAEVLVPAFLAGQDATAVLRELTRLRLVQLLSAGAEAWVDVVPDGVWLSDCRGAHGGATAEWVVAVLLAHYRSLPRFVRAQDGSTWDYCQTEELAGKRVLLVGAGDLADQTHRRLAGFDVETTLVARRARPGVHGVAELPGLLPHHDAVVLLVPLTPETEGLVDRDFLAAMRDGALLVNAARGKVVQTDALVAELASGRLCAALDVTEPEPLPPGHPLWSCPGLLLTPHVGGSVPGGMGRAYAVAAQQIVAYARGEEPPNLVRDGY